MYTVNVTKSASSNLDFSYSSTRSVSGSAKLAIDELLPTGTSDIPVNFTFSTGSGVLLALATNLQAYPITVKTNNSSSAVNVFSITNSSQIIYDDIPRSIDSNGVALQDISRFYVSNTGALSATFRVDSIFDNTPSI